MVNFKARAFLELKNIYDEFKSSLISLIDISKRYKFSTIILVLWIISIPFLFYLLNGFTISNELFRIELPIILSWGPILISFYQIIRTSDQ